MKPLTRHQEDEMVLAEIIASIETHDLALAQDGDVIDVDKRQMCALGAWMLSDAKRADVRRRGIVRLGGESALTVLTMRGHAPEYIAGVNDGFEDNSGALNDNGYAVARCGTLYRRGWSIGRAVAGYAGLP